MTLELIKRHCQEGIGMVYGETVPEGDSAFIMSENTYNKLIVLFEKIEKIANGLQQNSTSI